MDFEANGAYTERYFFCDMGQTTPPSFIVAPSTDECLGWNKQRGDSLRFHRIANRFISNFLVLVLGIFFLNFRRVGEKQNLMSNMQTDVYQEMDSEINMACVM